MLLGLPHYICRSSRAGVASLIYVSGIRIDFGCTVLAEKFADLIKARSNVAYRDGEDGAFFLVAGTTLGSMRPPAENGCSLA